LNFFNLHFSSCATLFMHLAAADVCTCVLHCTACCHCTTGIARAADPCAPTLNFFPTADEIGAPQLINNKTCKGDTVCNFPAVWQQKNQTAYTTKLQTTLDNGLFKVAFKQYGNEKPRLFFTPISPFLNEGSDVTKCALSRLPVPATRRLRQEDEQRYTVATAGEWSYSVSYDGAPSEEGDQIAGRSGQLDPLQLNKDVSYTGSPASLQETAAKLSRNCQHHMHSHCLVAK
jgi:hypothetical protein